MDLTFLRGSLQKCASLLVEPEEGRPAPSAAAGGSEVNKLFAELERSAESGQKPGARTVEQIVRDTPGPNLEDIKAPAASVDALSTAADGKTDFSAVYHVAGLPETPFTAEQVLEMLKELPAELPLETRRKTVRVTLNAVSKPLGATPDTIVADASRKLAALSAYAHDLSEGTEQFVAATQAEITALQNEIEEKRKAIEAARTKVSQGTQACTAESERLEEVVEFFSLDVHPSKYAAPTAS